MTDYFRKLLTAHKNGTAAGIVSICSANPFVIRAALENARSDNCPAVIESTGQQVNQHGGYSGFTPAEFARHIRQTAKSTGLDETQVILGADHLGPGPWQAETADAAMAKACELVRQCVYAGYTKLHLDPSMPCKDDLKNSRPHISLETIARRTARLCNTAETSAAERSGGKIQLVYAVGAEVPVPGGMGPGKNEIRVSSAEDIQNTLHIMQQVFFKNGLSQAWDRCVAVVAETGATFDAETIYPYDSSKTRDLQLFIKKRKNLVFEAHSTDFQTRAALTDMVRDHFAILKAGPCLSFAAREALFALSAIERNFLGNRKSVTLSALVTVMKKLMFRDHTHWRHHYSGSDEYLNYINIFGFSDRIRYYWSLTEARTAVGQLFKNLTRYGVPLPLISQYLPDLMDGVKIGNVIPAPEQLVTGKIIKVLKIYAAACGSEPASKFNKNI